MAPQETETPLDWGAWHTDYDSDTPLRRRLEIVQRHIATVLDSFAGSPLRVISMCAGEARDLLGAVERQKRRDLRGALVELDPELAFRARRKADDLGLAGLDVIDADAGWTRPYRKAAPADLVLVCGVLGNIEDSDVERTLRALPMLCANGAVVIWTRHTGPPDLTPSIRAWLIGVGFEELAYERVPDSSGSVGVARFTGETSPFVEQPLFTFTRTQF